jgi:putative transposase
VRLRLRELVAVRRRFGYRRLHILMRREGFVVNHKKLRRLYCKERRLPPVRAALWKEF